MELTSHKDSEGEIRCELERAAYVRKGIGRRIASSEDGGTVPDDDSKQLRLAKIEASLNVMRQLFSLDGIRSVLQLWEYQKKGPNPQFPSVSYGSILPEHVEISALPSSPSLSASLYDACLELLPECVKCISAPAWEKLAPYFGKSSLEENVITWNVVWLYPHGVRLSLADRTLIEKGTWLTDNVIDAAQEILRHQFPAVAGLRRTTTFAVSHSDNAKGEKFLDTVDCLRAVHKTRSTGCRRHLHDTSGRQVPILFVAHNHWMTVSNIHGDNTNDVTLYDSLSTVWKHTLYYQTMVAAVFHDEHPTLRLTFPSTHKQPNSSDCDVYAIAYAVSLALGEKPESLCYDTSLMRDHLIKCLKAEKFSAFPTAVASRSTKTHTIPTMKSEEITLYCCCRTPLAYPAESTKICQNQDKGCRIKRVHQSCTAEGRKPHNPYNANLRFKCDSCRKSYMDQRD